MGLLNPDKKGLLLLGSAFLLVLHVIPFLFLTGYVVPQGDDYCYLELIKELGVLGTAEFKYFNWTGRFSSTLVTSFVLESYMEYSRTGMIAAAFLIQSLFYTSIFVLLSQVLHRAALLHRVLVFAAIVICVLHGFQSPVEAFYWITSVVMFTVPISFVLLVAAAVVRHHRVGKLWLHLAIALPLVLYISMSNELAVILMAAFLGGSFAYKRVALSQWSGIELVLLAALLGVSMFMFLAPGNGVRMASHGVGENSASLIPLVFGALVHSVKVFFNWCSTTPILPFLVALVLLGKSQPRKWLHIVPLFALPFLLLALCEVIGFYALRGVPPGRFQNIAAIAFFVPLVLSVAFYFNQVSSALNSREFVAIVICLIVPLAMVKNTDRFVGNLGQAYTAVFDSKASRHLDIYEARMAQIESGEAHVIHLDEAPLELLMYSDLSSTYNYVVTCYSTFYGTEARAKEDKVPVQE